MLDKYTITTLNGLKQFTETNHYVLKQQTYKVALFRNSLMWQIIRQLPQEISTYNRFSEDDLDFYTLLDSLHSHNLYYTYVDSKTIENLSINDLQDESKLGYFYCLYYCNPLIVLDNKNKTTLNSRVITQNFGYKNDFYLSFLSNKDSITDEYLEARKSLYKSISQLKQEKQKQELQELQKQQEKALRDKQGQEQQQARLNKHSNLILESQDKSIQIIFLDTSRSLSHLIHIHNNKIDIFTKDKTYLDIQELESLLQEYVNTNTESNNTKQGLPMSLDILNSPSTQIFFYSHLLTGSSEIQSNPFFFGTPDTKSNIGLDESKPIYHFSPKDEENNLGTLTIFLNSCTLTLLNYSLLDSSLNIKLECNSKESKAILEREQIQREQIQRESTPIDSLTSTALLHPILEDDEIKCPHNGVVKLKSNKGKPFTSKGIPMILESDLLHSSIIGCTNNIAGVPTPCCVV
ncbi:hypothetical protein [uncultured Helicobacter sp.]|uniref:hypothetical protein n=1 Tax=uncultured Helicobacter sp. TaxID=175537 RepID=UPI00374E9C7A